MPIPTVVVYSQHGERIIVNECDALEYVTRRGYSTTNPKGGTFMRESAEKEKPNESKPSKGASS